MVGKREKLDELLKKARDLPKVPGVYLMKDDKGVVIYVGKASNLPDRVSSYFVPSATTSGNLGPKKTPMLDIITPKPCSPTRNTSEAMPAISGWID